MFGILIVILVTNIIMRATYRPKNIGMHLDPT